MGWQSGHRIGARFVVDGRLAMGGMAQVYVAQMQQARGLTRAVALKRVHPHLAEDPEFVSMFVDEARIVGQLAHPGIVPVIDAVEHGGDLMLVMDYVPGWDLKAVLGEARGRRDVPLEVAAQIARRAAETLAYVHGARDREGAPLDIVHRDVTPSNLLVGADGRVRLLDFGVAKAARRSTRTATRAIKGKLAYLSPEQARGEGAGRASDVYALGLVLWEMLVGRRAIDGDDDFAVMRHAAEPEHAPIALHRPDSPEAIDALVARALATRPEERPDAQTIAEGLAPFASDDAAVAAFVAEVMGAPSRPVEAGRSSVDQALLAVLADGGFSGVSLAGERITRPPLAPGELASFDAAEDEATSLDPMPSGARVAAATPIVHHATAQPEPTQPESAGPQSPGPQSPGPQSPGPQSPGPQSPGLEPLPLGTATPETARPAATPRPARAWPIALLGLVLALGAAAGAAAWLRLGTDPAPAATPPRASAAAPAPGFVRVTTTPPGATVQVEGARWPEPTPTVVEVQAGAPVEIALSLDDHREVTAQVTPAAGETTPLDRALQRLPGRLTVRSTPSGAAVRLDGEARGNTPLTLEGLPRRALALEVSAEGPYRAFTRTVDLDAEAEAVIDARLPRVQARGGALLVMALPATVQVSVDGRRVPAGAWPLRVEVGPGAHTVRVTNPANGRSATRRARVEGGGTARVVGIDLR